MFHSRSNVKECSIDVSNLFRCRLVLKIFIPVSALWARYLEPAYLPVISVAQHQLIAVKKERQKTTRGRFFTGAEGGLSYLSLFSTDLITTYSSALAPSNPFWLGLPFRQGSFLFPAFFLPPFCLFLSFSSLVIGDRS